MASSQRNQELKERFRNQLLGYTESFNKAVATDKGDWVVKGFIDVAKNIYTISADTKVISKIMELLLFPQLCEFAENHQYEMILSKEQNFYPDISFIDVQNRKFAVDLKSSYRKSSKTVNGMTLGAFTGYFRDRKSTKNTAFPYDDYIGHFVLGMVYSRVEDAVDERKVYKLNDLKNITSVIQDFELFVHEKYKIAGTNPGSGNTKNIGSVKNLHQLLNGQGPFTELGEDVFDDYWMYYLAKDMARAVDLKEAPYHNLETYRKYKGLKR
ncbi:MAG: EcoRV family type II restriction endonuclease [Sedimentisphaerales bacterium]|nr:EcoRV family type II restriction endonuclease [Sedimentisphaerales bacterium]